MTYLPQKSKFKIDFKMDRDEAIKQNTYLKLLLGQYISLTDLRLRYHAYRMDHRRKSTAEHIQKIRDCEEEIKFYTDILKTETDCFLKEEN